MMKENYILNNGFKIELHTLGDAGWYDLVVYKTLSEETRLKLGLGQPISSAKRAAELLAITIDAELWINHKRVRMSNTAEYYIKENAL